MRFLTHIESANWCQSNGYPSLDADCYGYPAPAVDEHFGFISLKYPVDSGKKVSLAHDVMEWFKNSNKLLFWIADWAVWPSCQHMPLFERFREAFGETRPLIEAPGHLIEASEFDDGISVLATSLLFFWDCHVIPAEMGPVFHCSHDEWNGFFVPQNYDSTQIRESFSHWLPRTRGRRKMKPDPG